MRAASRVSCRRTQKRANESPSGWVQTFQSSSVVDEADGQASRRRSQSTPEAAQVGARQAVGRATSAGMTPMPRVRAWKISLPMSRSSISSQKSRMLVHHGLCVSAIQPLGRSSLRPPMRSKLGWKRPPVTASIRLRTCSRSRKA